MEKVKQVCGAQTEMLVADFKSISWTAGVAT